MNKFTEPVERIVEEGRIYLDQQLDNVKLRTVKGLSQGTSALAGMLLIFAVGGALLLVLSFALVMWLGEMMDSYALAAFIVAAVLLVAVVVLVLVYKKLFRNTFVSMYAEILQPQQKESTQEGLDGAIENTKEHIREQEYVMKACLNQVQDYYTPSHLLNEGLRQAGLRAGKARYSLASRIPSILRFFLFRNKKKK